MPGAVYSNRQVTGDRRKLWRYYHVTSIERSFQSFKASRWTRFDVKRRERSLFSCILAKDSSGTTLYRDSVANGMLEC